METELGCRNTRREERTTQGYGYDDNRRDLRHEWKDPNDAVVTAYLNTYNGANRRTSETREHLNDEVDTYAFDAIYRVISFDRTGVASSTRILSATDKASKFSEEGLHANPQDNGQGMNQYGAFGPKRDRRYDDNGALTEGNHHTLRYDYDSRLVIMSEEDGEADEWIYAYTTDNRRVGKIPASGVGNIIRYTYDGWQVLEERVGDFRPHSPAVRRWS